MEQTMEAANPARETIILETCQRKEPCQTRAAEETANIAPSTPELRFLDKNTWIAMNELGETYLQVLNLPRPRPRRGSTCVYTFCMFTQVATNGRTGCMATLKLGVGGECRNGKWL